MVRSNREAIQMFDWLGYGRLLGPGSESTNKGTAIGWCKNAPRPTTKKRIPSFLGLTGLC